MSYGSAPILNSGWRSSFRSTLCDQLLKETSNKTNPQITQKRICVICGFLSERAARSDSLLPHILRAMGKILCEKHGGQGIVFTCPHVCQDIQSGTTTIDCLVTTTHETGTFMDQVIAIELGCCDACAKPYEAALREEILTDTPSELGDQTKPVCGECFHVFRETVRPCDSH